MSIFTFNYYLRLILIKTGIRKVIPLTESQTGNKKNRKVVSQNHGFRKFTHTTMANKRINPEIREMLLGHKIGLSSSYYRPSETELLEEYLRVIPDLTINQENRLSRQVQELQEQDDYQKFIIDKKMKEKDEQIKILMFKIDKLSEKEQQFDVIQNEGRIISRDLNNQLIELGKQFEELTARLDIKEEEKEE